MARMIRDAWIASIRAQHDFNAEVSRRVFVGPRARQYARDWAEREIEHQTHDADWRDPDNADIHTFCAVHTETTVEIDL
jgi:hypothetical protein